MGGRPLIAHGLRRVAAVPSIGSVVVVCPDDRHPEVRRIADELGIVGLRCIAGGPRRRDSVAAGLALVGDSELVVVHDAARPLASPRLFRSVIEAARLHGAATAAVPCVDTIKRVEAGMVVETLPRSGLVAVQTPQAFATALLRRAHQLDADEDVSDDCVLVERLGEPVAVVAGEPANLKVTRLEDFAWFQDQLRRMGEL